MAKLDKEIYYQGVWQRELSLFSHYSTVRMAILAILIPLGGNIIIQHQLCAGTFLIFLAYLMNLYFGVGKALKRWLAHMNIDLWREIGDADKDYEVMYRQNFPGYYWVVFGCLSDYDFKKPEGNNIWEIEWGKVLDRARKTEFFLQLMVIVGVIIFYALLLRGLYF
jgi:hypothetical protein